MEFTLSGLTQPQKKGYAKVTVASTRIDGLDYIISRQLFYVEVAGSNSVTGFMSLVDAFQAWYPFADNILVDVAVKATYLIFAWPLVAPPIFWYFVYVNSTFFILILMWFIL